MRILALSVFERVVYHCVCLDESEPGRVVLEVDALLRDGDADGPLLVPVAEYKRMIGFDAAAGHLPDLRSAGRTEWRDHVEHLVFPLWQARPEAE